MSHFAGRSFVHIATDSNAAYTLSAQQKKQVAFKALSNHSSISTLTKENNTSRKFIREQRDKAKTAIDQAFDSSHDEVMFYLPITQSWIEQCVIALMLLAHASYRNIMLFLKDLFDIDLSLGAIHNLFNQTAKKAQALNAEEDLSHIEVMAAD